MIDSLENLIADLRKRGKRIWHLGESTRGLWSAILYNEAHTRIGWGSDVFSPSAKAATPEAALRIADEWGFTHYHISEVTGPMVPDAHARKMITALDAATARIDRVLKELA